MTDSHIPTKLKHDDQEQPLWTGTFAARSMIGGWISAALLTGLLSVALFRIEVLANNPPARWTTLTIIGTVWLLLISVTVYRKLGQHFELTNQRLLHRSGILIRRMNRIELIDIDDVSFQQGPLQSLLNVGSIRLESSDKSHPQLVMPGISGVRHVADLIDNARRHERRTRGIHVEAI